MKQGPILFIGLGSIGQRHLRNIRAFLGWEVKIIAVRVHGRSPLLNEAREVIPDRSIESEYDVIQCNSLDQAIAMGPTAAFICNPSSEHFGVLEQTLSAGVPTFVEKPIVTNFEDLKILETVAADDHPRCMVGYQMRFHPGLLCIKDWLSQNAIGKVIYVQIYHGEYLPNFHPYEDYRPLYASRKELGGGVILTQTHEIDYALWLIGAPSSVSCVGGKTSDLEIDVEDHALINMVCESDQGRVPISIALDYMRNPAERGCRIIGEEGIIAIDFYKEKRATFRNWKKDEDDSLDFSGLDINELFKKAIEVFFSEQSVNRAGGSDLTAGVVSTKVGMLARDSMGKGGVCYEI